MEINIKDLNFSEEDIKLLLDALESLPSRDLAGDMMIAMLEGMTMDKDDPDRAIKHRKSMEDRERSKKAAKEALKEEVIILQGKILQFKRYLMQENALKQANDILTKQ